MADATSTRFRWAAAAAMALGLASGPAWADTATQGAPNPPLPGYTRETPASLKCIYQLVTPVTGCDPNNAAVANNQNTTLGGAVIVVVGRYHYANLASDLAAYSAQFNLPAPNLTVVTSSTATNCTTAPQDSDQFSNYLTTNSCFLRGTDVLEVAHAMAPQAALVYVETSNATAAQLRAAVTLATSQATAKGGGEVVFAAYYGSDAGSPIASSLEPVFQPSSTNSNVLYFAPTGYAGSVYYPGTSPNVVSVSSSDIARDMENPSNLNQFLSERVGDGSAGGLSTLYAAPAYQNRIATRINNANKRAVPDLVATGNSNNNIWVYNSTTSSNGGWFGASGASMATGIAAGIANAANASASFKSTSALLTSMYSKVNTSAFFDVGIGMCGASDGAFATVADRNSTTNAWDFCSGVGAPRGLAGFKP